MEITQARKKSSDVFHQVDNVLQRNRKKHIPHE